MAEHPSSEGIKKAADSLPFIYKDGEFVERLRSAVHLGMVENPPKSC